MIQREKHLLKGPSVNFYCFSKPYVNYFKYYACRDRLTGYEFTASGDQWESAL